MPRGAGSSDEYSARLWPSGAHVLKRASPLQRVVASSVHGESPRFAPSTVPRWCAAVAIAEEAMRKGAPVRRGVACVAQDAASLEREPGGARVSLVRFASGVANAAGAFGGDGQPSCGAPHSGLRHKDATFASRTMGMRPRSHPMNARRPCARSEQRLRNEEPIGNTS